jgi:SAM-dependent methyltransferase
VPARACGGGDLSDPGERERLQGVFAAYAASARRRRAWRADNPGNVAIREELARTVLGIAGDVIAREEPLLDLGCGTGWWLERLAQTRVAPERLRGVELLPERARATAERVRGADVVAGDARDLPFEDRTVALVTLFTVLSSVATDDDIRAVLREAERVTAHGGWIVVWEPRVVTPANRHTRLVRMRVLRGTLGEPDGMRCLTLLPPLARQLRSAGSYDRLASVPALRTHRLVWWRK